MIILTIRTDNPEAEVGLYDDNNKIEYLKWMAHRELSVTIHHKIKSILDNADKSWTDIEAVVVYKGPGSFTGLRIGISLANALAYGLKIPISGTKGAKWLNTGIKNVQNGKNDHQVLPHYGAEPNITKPRK